MFFTIGHSRRALDDFLGLVMDAGCGHVLDVRARPRSRRFPWFNQEPLSEALSSRGVRYHGLGTSLGGMRHTRPDSPHRALDVGLRGFADYMEGEEFDAALSRARGLARHGDALLLCAEADPRHCHRSLIADALLLAGETVVHVLGPAANRVHRLRPEARVVGGDLIYDRNASGVLPFR